MTNNKPNDVRVVPFELLERVCKADASMGASAIQLMDGWVAMGELRAILAQPADQQGEPVAWVECSPAWLKSGGDCATAPRICVGRNGISHLHPAHAQPATAKVVLPARMPTGNITTPNHEWSPNVREGWNACLDEVAKLNGIQS